MSLEGRRKRQMTNIMGLSLRSVHSLNYKIAACLPACLSACTLFSLPQNSSASTERPVTSKNCFSLASRHFMSLRTSLLRISFSPTTSS
jgi:hypothetical protein